MKSNQSGTYIAYLRQSTMKQQASGLGIEAQTEIIKNYVKNDSKILQTYIETETGKNNHRPKLSEALEQCRQTGSILICAKLDRLSRNFAFTSRLLESDVEIIFCDFPKANRFILHIISSIAEYEARLISERTRQSLKAKKDKGIKLGKPENLLNNHARAIANSTRTNKAKARNNENNRRALALIIMMRRENKTYLQITSTLNRQGFKTSKGYRFTTSQVWRLYKRHQEEEER
ncbi:recombinase family protein [Proteiniphilum sp.]|uniref:recombinase family protein n=1 Tax=Proteiniphilum sp. TaxID=1926877 RepID=UPI002B1EF015|nr:recombinase family protein [Proteiniphilum sp.]MEA4918302.1 recombinase family protein [Proteiniphilum sp.]